MVTSKLLQNWVLNLLLRIFGPDISLVTAGNCIGRVLPVTCRHTIIEIQRNLLSFSGFGVSVTC